MRSLSRRGRNRIPCSPRRAIFSGPRICIAGIPPRRAAPLPISLPSINHPLSVMWSCRLGSEFPMGADLSLGETRGAPSGVTTGDARRISRRHRRRPWPARRMGTSGRYGSRSGEISRSDHLLMIFCMLSPWLFSSPGLTDVRAARRPPGTIGTGEPSRSLTGRPASFQWAGAARPFPFLPCRLHLRLFSLSFERLAQARPAPNPVRHGPGSLSCE